MRLCCGLNVVVIALVAVAAGCVEDSCDADTPIAIDIGGESFVDEATLDFGVLASLADWVRLVLARDELSLRVPVR